MKNIIVKTLFGKNAVASLLLVFGIFFLVGFACNSGSKPLSSDYVGFWTGADGSIITLRGDATGDYKSGGTTVSGGAVEINDAEKTLTIKLMGMGPTFKIDKAPSGNRMTLDGVVYKKSGESDSKSDSKSDSSTPEVPSNDKLQTLVKTTFMDFSDAVQSEDFSDFHKKVAKVWQDGTSPDEMLDAFKAFVDNKASYDFKKAVSPLDATFSPSPAIEKVSGLDALVVKGYYPTKPERANFELKYTMEDGTWKLIGINVKTTGK